MLNIRTVRDSGTSSSMPGCGLGKFEFNPDLVGQCPI